MVLAKTSYDKSSSLTNLGLPYAAAQLPPLLSSDSSTRMFPTLTSDNIHAYVSAATMRFASLHHNRLTDGVLRHSTQTIFTPILENESDCFG